MYYIYVAVFGAVGAAARYRIGNMFFQGVFPYDILLVNLTGCFLLPVVLKYLSACTRIPKALLTGMGTGLIGAFTTFSAFSVETACLISDKEYGIAGLYVITSCLGGFLAAAAGVYVSNQLIRRKELEGHD